MFRAMTLAGSFIILVFSCVLSAPVFASNTASALFKQKFPLVFQIRVIDIASGNKSTLGSGFQVAPQGVLATNYHVVSEYLLHKGKYTIVAVDSHHRKWNASVINFDIVHDLALLKINSPVKAALSLDTTPLAQGSRLYSMGDPNDLGMTIVEGTYNGLVDGSRYRKYLFSGSLNPGMSGGPVFNTEGRVIGINDEKGGEQLGFLVPAFHLAHLIRTTKKTLNPDDYFIHAAQEMIKDQNSYYGMLLQKKWLTKKFQQFNLPDRIDHSLKCWGYTEDNPDALFKATHRRCRTTDQIFINDNFYTGSFAFSYLGITSDRLNSFQFYNLLSTRDALEYFPNGGDKEDTTNFDCSTNFVDLDLKSDKTQRPWKVTTCIRRYRKYKGLYDAGLIAVHDDSKGSKHAALIIALYTTGIDKNNIMLIHQKFLDAVK